MEAAVGIWHYENIKMSLRRRKSQKIYTPPPQKRPDKTLVRSPSRISAALRRESILSPHLPLQARSQNLLQALRLGCMRVEPSRSKCPRRDIHHWRLPIGHVTSFRNSACIAYTTFSRWRTCRVWEGGGLGGAGDKGREGLRNVRSGSEKSFDYRA